MSNKKNAGATLRCKNMMYTQQLKHLPFNDIDALEEAVAKLPKLKDYGLIVHDKDVANGVMVEPHVHVMMRFTDANRINTIAKELKDKPQNIAYWKGDSKNGYSYLIHKTEHSRNKYQYEVSEVRANFDYPQMMLSIAQEIEKKYKKVSVNLMLDALMRGDITKTQLENMLTGSQYADNKRRIETVYSKHLDNMANSYKDYMKLNNVCSKVIWIYGYAGTGKTKLAREYASRTDSDYYISGSTRDLFQKYEGQHVIVLDELRPKSIEVYADLLRIFDPFGEDKMAPSRYFDKSIVCDLIIITSPYNPHEFYKALCLDESIDTFEQLNRRITLTIHMTDTSICMADYIPRAEIYRDNLATVKNNSYSSWNSMNFSPLNVNILYNDIVK